MLNRRQGQDSLTDISGVRRDILSLFAGAVICGGFLLLVIDVLVLRLPVGMDGLWWAYLFFMPPPAIGWLVFLYFYLRPIAALAEAHAGGEALAPDMLQRARTLAFQAPVYFLVIPVVLTFVAATAADIFGLVFVQDYIFTARYVSSVLITIIVLALSLIASLVSRRILMPVLFFTAGLAQDIGPRIDVRTRQLAMTFLVSLITIVFLGMVGYNLVLQGTQYGYQEKYELLGELLSGTLGAQMSDAELRAYVETLTWDAAQAFIINSQAGEVLTPISERYQLLHVLAGTVAPRLLTTEARLGPLPAPGGELLFFDLHRAEQQWWLGIFYYVRPLNVPVVRDTILVLMGFVAIMTLIVYTTNRYLSEDFSREIEYVTGRLIALTEEPTANFEKLTVLSLDEVGDLVTAFNALLGRVEQQQAKMARDKSELRALLEVTRDIGFILDTDTLLAQVVHSLDRIFGYAESAIFLVDAPAQEVYVAAYPPYLLPSIQGQRWPLDPDSVVGRVALTGQPLLKVAGDDWRSYIPLRYGVRSELAVPMLVGGAVVGVCDVVNAEPYAFDEEDLRVVAAVADQATLALQNARLYREIEEQRQASTALVQLAKTVTSTLDLQQVLALALEHLEQVVAYDTSSILLMEGELLTIAAERGFEAAEERVGKTYHPAEKPLGYQVMLSQQVRVVADVQVLADWTAAASPAEHARAVRAWIGAALVVEGVSLGLLAIDKFEPHFYSAADGRLAAAFADQIAIAVQNARSYAAAQERAKEMALLQEVSQRISALMVLGEAALLTEIAQRVMDTFDYQFVSIHMLNRETGVLEFTAQRGHVERTIPKNLLYIGGPGIVPWVAEHGEPLLITDVTQDERYVAVASNIRSELAIPLVMDTEVVGVFNLESEQQNAFDAHDIQLMTALSNQIAIALKNAQLFQDVREQAKRLTLLQEVSQKISSILDIDQLLHEVCRAVVEAFGYQHAAVLLVDDVAHELYFGAQVGYDDSITAMRLAIYDLQGVVTEAAATLAPVLVPDVSQHPRYISGLASVQSELAIPLLAGERLVGVFNLESNALNGFDEKDLRLMTALGQQITGALESARLFQSVREQANELAQMAGTLADEKSKLDAILHNIADGLLVTYPNGEILLVNPVFEYIFGRPAAVLLGRPLGEVLPDRDLVRLIDSAQNDVEASFSAELRRPDGRTLKATASAIQEDGRFLGVATVVRDITYEKEVDRMKTEFISAVSHELRTPLTSVLGFAKLISRTFEKDVFPHIVEDDRRTARAARRIRNNLDIIVLEGERLTRLINDVLDISKMEAGNIEWQDRPFEMETALQHVAERMRAEAELKGLIFEVCLPEVPVQLVADPNRVRQVLFNLLSNAFKFTEAGQVTLRARHLAPGEVVHGWTAPEAGGGGVLCSVADTGVGISPEALPRLFHRFQQIVTDTLTDKPTGTGLGLAISREIVSHYGGSIWAESRPGDGATFYFTLPLQPQAGEESLAPPVISAARPRPTEGLPLVLVVDDEPHIRSLLAQELEGHGYRTLEAESGTEAISLARHHIPRPALILLDVMMPGLSGFDVTRILKSDPLTENIPILILSIVEERERGMALGADEYLIKPIDVTALMEAVGALLARVQPSGAVAETRELFASVTAVLQQQGFTLIRACDATDAPLAEAHASAVHIAAQLHTVPGVKGLCFQNATATYTVIVLAGALTAAADG